MITSRGPDPHVFVVSDQAAGNAALLPIKLGRSPGDGKPEENGDKAPSPLPFRAQSVEKLVENYSRPKIKSTRLT
jgi:hypothetical protein